MRVGQRFGAGKDSITLFCEVTSIDSVGIHAHVINGAWNITFTPSQTICHHPSGDSVIPARILYTGDLPAELRLSYGTATYMEALELMNDRFNSKVPMWWYTAMHALQVRVARLTNALSAAKRAFIDSWNPPKPEYNDDIPF